MILNHLRQRVAEHAGGDSHCPLCERPLIARRGDLVIWHWAHKANPLGHDACPFEESPWHLGCKDAYSKFPGWEIEFPMQIEGQKFIFDAFNPTTGRVREFVHTLSPYYAEKHQLIAAHFSDVRWLFDGCAFASRHRALTRDGRGIRNLLKPRALLVAEKLQPRVSVLFTDVLVKYWKNNVGYRVTSERAQSLARQLTATAAARRIERESRIA